MAKNQKEEQWVSCPKEVYERLVPAYVHFSAKTVNSNIEGFGIRLGSDDTLDWPYLSARTMLHAGADLPLDYTKFSATSGFTAICRQVAAVILGTGLASKAPTEEREVIVKLLEQMKPQRHVEGRVHLDHRLRQILLPKGETFVALTPMTSTGLCEILFNPEKGIVTAHNARDDRSENKEGQGAQCRSRKIPQANFAIGGSKTQNVGALAATGLRTPMYLKAPNSTHTLKTAFAYYHKGISLDFAKAGPLMDALEKYLDFRKRTGLDQQSGAGVLNLETREQERKIIGNIASLVLEMAEEAKLCILEHKGSIQTKNPDGSLVSPRLPHYMQALVDDSLRDSQWPREMAVEVAQRMLGFRNSRKQVQLVLDPVGFASLVGMLEEVFR